MSRAVSWREHIPRGVVAETAQRRGGNSIPRESEKRREESKNFSQNLTLLHRFVAGTGAKGLLHRFQPRTGAKGSQYNCPRAPLLLHFARTNTGNSPIFPAAPPAPAPVAPSLLPPPAAPPARRRRARAPPLAPRRAAPAAASPRAPRRLPASPRAVAPPLRPRARPPPLPRRRCPTPPPRAGQADSDSDNKRPDPEDPELNSIQRRVKKWALKKMATQFNDYKKKLDNSFIKKKKTPDFKGPYEKIKDHWEAFVKYKTSERAKTRSDTNKKNAANKMYFHTMGRGGYKAGRPKWEKWENDLIKNGIQPEGSQRKSSVASTELPGDDADVDPQMAPPSPVDPQMPSDLYPVDFITESTPCELHFQTMGYLTLKAAIGYVLPPVPDQRYHFKPVPPGYAVAGVDQVMDGYGPLRLDHPAGEGDLLELGEAKNTTVLWRKEFIVIPGWKAPTRSPPSQHSPPMQPSP
ncbi:hypothetical protein QYE76_014629 [Lolium multiflorum]|uniref:DUF8039 domain-containing protein n=1 Tax=Lolium multiflorum TaxID=4521 RepID=A0AAD8U563_LOLMU|nr:hypothetical protein QYE76_014629 [Lolium multiflorum]